ncbi:IS1595 family transposase [Candidatus Bathyarchaeota archaeon]|nr:IS1595 family transposase [Candidatus Bathyarchaeota archaeon]
MRSYSIKDFNKQFPDDDACLDWLRQHRFPKMIDCPVCKQPRLFHRVNKRKVYECDRCGYQVSPTAGTILHKSPTPLRSWFYAAYLMSTTRTGISAKQLQRELSVTYKTAWRMFTQIRKLMSESVNPLAGQVEVDETYIGGKRAGKRGRGASGKSVVMGMVERQGNAIARVVPNVKARTLLPMIETRVARENKTVVFTDELHSYDNIERLGYAHAVVQHAAKQYVSGIAHVNTVESLWSTIKRGIDGVNHSVSPLYLQSYLDSYVFRYNHRKDEQPMFASLLTRIPETYQKQDGQRPSPT